MVDDVAGLRRLSADLDRSAARAALAAAAVTERAAVNVKTEWQRTSTVTAGRMAGQYPATITYSPKLTLGGAAFEVGPEAHGQGNLGPILEDGSVNSPPHRDGAKAADVEAPRFAKAMSDLADPL